jgi:broad specificity phosphatase PhoE
MNLEYDQIELDESELNEDIEHSENVYGIDVDAYIYRYSVDHPRLIDTLYKFPTLCYLLGNVTEESQGKDTRPDDFERNIHILTEGSGMFGLKNPEDAMRWKGIFNHIMGSTRQVYWLANRLKNITSEQKQQFVAHGYDIDSINDIDPELMRDFMFISHSGRRASDEQNWHGIADEIHQYQDSGMATIMHLSKEETDKELLKLMNMEVNLHMSTVQFNGSRISPNVMLSIMAYGDWTYNQKPIYLSDKFSSLKKTKRNTLEMFELYEEVGTSFENTLKEIISPTIWEEMVKAGPYDWEQEIRDAYCAPSGVDTHDTFPLYGNSVFVFRHGEVEPIYNEQGEKVIYGPNAHLSEIGKQHIRKLAQALKNNGVHLDEIYTSPYIRTIESSEILAIELDIPYDHIFQAPDLHDTNAPGFVGRPVKEYENIYTIPPRTQDQETLDDMANRSFPYVQKLMKQSQGKTIGIMTHGDVSRMIVRKNDYPNAPLPSWKELVSSEYLGNATGWQYQMNEIGMPIQRSWVGESNT